MSATPRSNWGVPLFLLTLGCSIDLVVVEWVLPRERGRRDLPVARQRISLLGARS